jgi:hypothetical protein
MRLNVFEQGLAGSPPRHGVPPSPSRRRQSPRVSKLVANDQNLRARLRRPRALRQPTCGDVMEPGPPLLSDAATRA